MKKLLILFGSLTIFMSNTFSQSITNPDTACVNAVGESYWVTNTAGSTYNWTLVGGGGSITAGQGTSAILVDWGSVPGLYPDAIAVVETNAAGCTDTVLLDIYLIEATFTQIGPFCSYDPCVPLTGAPTGGVWSGTGVVLNGAVYEFCPTTSGVGSFDLTYTVDGCSVIMTVVVNAAPVIGPIWHN